ncbi:SDR family NAD(P)-dependent oxidoreductase [Zhongshania marina]|jgi:NAD(P)-dependent dehydrogenase (short-subunit alcohol dehydrogenase family)|uniref:SDR family NAD(P)-dependent oxidoreductase n=1 Tax=Zhongshania marina TaxID=2304603 RepID=A0ABX9VXZ4_9GAMM|nr:SDR family NAD(P)-dependent oxidoreductase [Zhongshania marina]
MKNFKTKVVVITGAASGIGRALALQLDREDAVLALVDKDASALAALNDATGHRHLVQELDVADRKAVYQFAARVSTELGGADVVINNAGVAVSQTIAELDYDDFEWLFNINFWGMVYGTKAFLPQLLTKPEAAIVNVSSLFGLLSIPTQGAYNASKFAIRGFTEALQAELKGTNITAHSVHPGGIRTNIARNARLYQAPGGVSDAEAGVDLFSRISFTDADKAASILLKGIQNKRARILIGPDAVALDIVQRLFPKQYTNAFNLFEQLLNRLTPLNKAKAPLTEITKA